jgi:kynurenine formamidase
MGRVTAAEYSELLVRAERVVASPAEPRAGLAEARTGRVVACGDVPPGPPLADGAAADGAPSPFRLTQWTDGGDGWTALNDRLELDVHGATAMTHVDTVAHFWRGERPARAIDPLLELARTGIVGRGVLVDLAAAGPGPVPLVALEAELARTGADVRPGDVLHLRFGRREQHPSDTVLGAQPTPGLSIDAADWLLAHRPSAIVTDEGLDPSPSEVEGSPVPWHVLVLTVVRIPLVDGAQLTPLATACADERRWSFLSVIAPLPVPTASGSPVNPLAIF